MKLSEVSIACEINPPRNGFGWKRLLNVILASIKKGDKASIKNIMTSYSPEDAQTVVSFIQSTDAKTYKDFVNQVVAKNESNLTKYLADDDLVKIVNHSKCILDYNKKFKIDETKNKLILKRLNKLLTEYPSSLIYKQLMYDFIVNWSPKMPAWNIYNSRNDYRDGSSYYESMNTFLEVETYNFLFERNILDSTDNEDADFNYIIYLYMSEYEYPKF